MTTRESDLNNCSRLLDYFPATELGEGDPTTGANVLAAMALTLSSLRRPGTAVQWDDSAPIPLQGGCVVTGSHSSSLVNDVIVSKLRQAQASVTAHNYDWHRFADTTSVIQPVSKESSVKPLIERLSKTDYDLEAQESGGHSLLINPPGFQPHWEIRNRPLFFSSISTPREIERFMPFANSGRLLAHVPINSAADVCAYSDHITRLLDGSNASLGIQYVCGEVISTDAFCHLAEAVQSGDPKTQWVLRMPWLVEQCSEDQFVVPDKMRANARRNLSARFAKAVDTALGKRLSVRDSRVELVRFKAPELQRHWIRFLKEFEPAWPGISGNMRHLFSSLCVGLMDLCNDQTLPADFVKSIQILVLAFARQLVRRMVCYRQSQLRDHHLNRLNHLAEWIQTILADGPKNIRTITRRKHKLRADVCREALEHLESNGTVVQVNDGWKLTKTPARIENHVTV